MSESINIEHCYNCDRIIERHNYKELVNMGFPPIEAIKLILNVNDYYNFPYFMKQQLKNNKYQYNITDEQLLNLNKKEILLQLLDNKLIPSNITEYISNILNNEKIPICCINTYVRKY